MESWGVDGLHAISSKNEPSRGPVALRLEERFAVLPSVLTISWCAEGDVDSVMEFSVAVELWCCRR